MLTEHLFAVECPPDLDDAALRAALAGVGALAPVAAADRSSTFFDSFDWRLWGAGYSLVEVCEGDATAVVWRDRSRGTVHGRLPGSVPRHAAELPAGRVRETLAPVLEMRALLPVGRATSQVESLELRNARGKLVVRLARERRVRVAGEGGALQELPERLRVEGVRGYDEPLAAVRRVLLQELALQPCEPDLLNAAAAAWGRRPGDYSSKVRVSLEPAVGAGQALGEILRQLLDAIRANEAGTLQDLDSEFLHDFRVAVRRTRAALGQLRRVLDKDAVRSFRKEFRWLGAITGPTRDLDVYRLTVPRYQAQLPPWAGAALEPFAAFLERRQAREQRALAKALRGRRYRRLVTAWDAFLSGLGESGLGPDGPRPVLEVANERIRRTYRAVLEEGAAVAPDSPREALHDLRKTCKKLRYLLEFFRSLYPEKAVGPALKVLKTFQDNLGEFQDLTVQTDALRAFAGELDRDGSAAADTLLAMGILIERLLGRQQQVRAEFDARFATFASAKNRAAFARLFSVPGE